MNTDNQQAHFLSPALLTLSDMGDLGVRTVNQENKVKFFRVKIVEDTGPKETAEIFNKHQENKDILIFDAGCGTGLVGQELKKYGFKKFHGADLSQTLLDAVPKALYQKLIKVDLNQPIDTKDNSYDAVMCVGTFTFGHVKPNALDEFVRITKPDGLICFTINEGIHEEYGFDKKIDILKDSKKWEKVEFFKSDYIASKDVNAWLGLYRVL